jgi:hypothetical protein
MTTAFPNGQFFAADGTVPGWLPVPQGNVPIVYADFVNGHYWYNGASYATLALWLTATSGTFTRTPAATYCGADGLIHSAATGVARFDYDPVTKQPLGIYLEPSFDNQILQSQTFANAAWTKTHVTATDASVVAPDGTTTGSLITETGSGSQAHEVAQNLVGNYGCLSVYARAGTGNFLNLAIDDGTANQYVQAVFDLSQGGITEYSTGNGNTSIGQVLIEPAPDFGDGWYHCILRITDNVGPPTAYTYHIGLAAAAHGNTYSNSGQALYASGGKTIYIWGAQAPSSPLFPFSYVATTTSFVAGGADKLTIGSSWDNASNSVTIVQVCDFRGFAQNINNVLNNGYFGANSDSWGLRGITVQGAFHGTFAQEAFTNTGQVPGVNKNAMRIDSTTVTMSSNGNAPVTSSADSARTAATSIRLGGYETSQDNALQMRLRSFAAWGVGLSNSVLQTLSKNQGVAVPSVVSTINGADTNWVGYPSFCVLPSGYLLVTYLRYHSSVNGAKPSQIMYHTAPGPTGPWSSAAVAVANTNSHVDLANFGSVVLPNGSIVGVCDPVDTSAPYTSGSGTLMGVVGTETSPGVVSWGALTPITGSPFFGVDAAGTEAGDFIASQPFLLPNGKYMQTLYGYKSGASSSNTSLGVIFSSTPADPTSWGNFIILANGDAFTPGRAFSEATPFLDSSNNIVIIVRQGNSISASNQDYWRVTCPAGADPTVLANWSSPIFVAFDGTVGKPDVLGLGNNGMVMFTRGGTGANELNGYVTNWNAAKAPFSSNRAALLSPTYTNFANWYSQSQLLPQTNFIGTAIAIDTVSTIPQILFLQSQINGVGQSQ